MSENETTERKHSPLPWEIGQFSRVVGGGLSVALVYVDVDASLIVEAVNGYDALVAYLRASDAYRRYWQDTLLGEVSESRANALRKDVMVAYRAIPAVTREKLEQK